MKVKITILCLAALMLFAGCSKQNKESETTEPVPEITTAVDDSAFELPVIEFDTTEAQEATPEQTQAASSDGRKDETTKAAETTASTTKTAEKPITAPEAAKDGTTKKETTTAKETTTKKETTTATTKSSTVPSGTGGTTPTSPTQPTMPTMPGFTGSAFETPEIPI